LIPSEKIPFLDLVIVTPHQRLREELYAVFNRALEIAGDFPVAEKVSPEIVSLPIFPQMIAGQQARVSQHLTALVSRLELA
jgi:dTDP-4-amino-4,6-dideoxygalactose transaminase